MDKGTIGAFSPGGGDREEGRCSCGRPLDMYEVHVSPTTGGQFRLRVAASDSIEYLRRLVSKRLRVPKERICLLYRDRHLRAGSLEENYIMEGARLTLLPSVETGLLTQRPEQSVMQALESLNDAQVHDFLTGKAPLNLTMRLGDHMMLIQLQLSTVSPSGGSKKNSSSRHSSSPTTAASVSSSVAGTSSGSSHHHHHHHHHHYHHHHHLHSSHQSHLSSPCGRSGTSSPSPSPPPLLLPSVSSTATLPSHHRHHHHHHNHRQSASSPSSTPPQPHHHHHHHHYCHHSQCPSSPSSPSSVSSSPSSCFPLDADVPIRGCPHQEAGLSDTKASLDTKALAEASRNLTQTLKQLSSEVLTTKPTEKESRTSSSDRRKVPKEPSCSPSGSSSPSHSSGAAPPPSSSKASRRQGAIIESMHHHGKGVYSGTFSGTLNPALQDRSGRPKRDISTIIHILNDLLCATPQYRRHSSSVNSQSLSGSSSSPSTSYNHASSRSHHQHSGTSSTSSACRRDYISSGCEGVSRLPSVYEEDDSSADDNQVTRTKLEHLKFIMEQRRARRKARREARSSPYSHIRSESSSNGGGSGVGEDCSGGSSSATSWSSEATTVVTGKTTTTAQSCQSDGQGIEVEAGEDSSDPTTLCELNSGTVVA